MYLTRPTSPQLQQFSASQRKVNEHRNVTLAAVNIMSDIPDIVARVCIINILKSLRRTEMMWWSVSKNELVGDRSWVDQSDQISSRNFNYLSSLFELMPHHILQSTESQQYHILTCHYSATTATLFYLNRSIWIKCHLWLFPPAVISFTSCLLSIGLQPPQIPQGLPGGIIC